MYGGSAGVGRHNRRRSVGLSGRAGILIQHPPTLKQTKAELTIAPKRPSAPGSLAPSGLAGGYERLKCGIPAQGKQIGVLGRPDFLALQAGRLPVILGQFLTQPKQGLVPIPQ